jgi:alkaline phosphatase
LYAQASVWLDRNAYKKNLNDFVNDPTGN